jgi:hypothetical protein
MTTKTDQPGAASPTTLDGDSDEERRQRQIELNQPVIALLQSWLEDDEESEEEQREALELLKRAIDENRLPGQKLFSKS